MLDVIINGTAHRFPDGLTILQALGQIKLDIPSVCYDLRARPGGDCRLCSVQVAGETHGSPACTRRLEQGMCIETHTPELEAFRRSMLELLARYCATDSPTVLPEKELHQWLLEYGVQPALAAANDQAALDDSHPYFRFDPAQCIACYRCVRICEDLQGQFVWHMVGKGESSHLVVDKGVRLADSSCVGCGACIDACPDRSGRKSVELRPRLQVIAPFDASAQAQAAQFVSLLDELAIELVAVIGASAGANSAIRFAIRHPDRTQALISASSPRASVPRLPSQRCAV